MSRFQKQPLISPCFTSVYVSLSLCILSNIRFVFKVRAFFSHLSVDEPSSLPIMLHMVKKTKVRYIIDVFLTVFVIVISVFGIAYAGYLLNHPGTSEW